MVISDPTLKAYVESPLSNEFGLSIDEVANACKSYGRFDAWLNQDVSLIKQVLNIVKDVGISPAFFASYEATEGYNSQWGWLNHTRQQGTYNQDAEYVANVVKTTSENMTVNPSWIDYGNPVDFVPANVKSEGNQHFQSMPSGTIGRAFIPLTAAATWEVYYPNGLKKEYNLIQDYGAPLTKSMQLIIQWGGSITGNNGGGGETGGGISKQRVLQIIQNKQGQLVEDVTINTGQLLNVIFDGIKNMITSSLYLMSGDFYKNSYFKLTKTFKNMQQLHPNDTFHGSLSDVIQEAIDSIEVDFSSNAEELFNQIIQEVNVLDDSGGEVDPTPSGDRFFPVDFTRTGINFWYPPYSDDLTHNMDFGERTSGDFHAGYDIGGGGRNHDVYAISGGTVVDARQAGGWGQIVTIEHSDDNLSMLYAHLVVGSNTVSTGDTVEAGQKIGVMGDSGGNYAIHLHMELSETGIFGDYETIDPKPYLKVTGNNATDLPNPV